MGHACKDREAEADIDVADGNVEVAEQPLKNAVASSTSRVPT
jgi:hypothetical protein